jgi:hypothetical protein
LRNTALRNQRIAFGNACGHLLLEITRVRQLCSSRIEIFLASGGIFRQLVLHKNGERLG